jgi:hypothetical protein
VHLRRELDEVEAPTTTTGQQPGAAVETNSPSPSAPTSGSTTDLLGAMGSDMSSPREFSTESPTQEEDSAWASDDEDRSSVVTTSGSSQPESSLIDLMAPVENVTPPPAQGSTPDTPPAPVSDLFALMSVTPNAVETEGIENGTRSQMKGWFAALVSTEAPGHLFRNTQIDILYKHEYRASQARISLKLVNNSGCRFTDVSFVVEKAAPHLRVVTTPAPGSEPAQLDAQAAQTYVVMAECMNPFASPPALIVKFTASPVKYKYEIPLPVLMTNFMAPAALEGQDFHSRWGRLTASGLEASQVIGSSMK